MVRLLPLVLVFIFLLTTASAIEVYRGDKVSIDAEEDENVLMFGGEVLVDALVRGDATVFGGSITVNAPIRKGLLACGGQITLNSDVTGTTHICGGSLTVNNKVNGDLQAFGGNINVNDNVNGDVKIFGGNININSRVSGDVIVFGGNVIINDNVAGDVVLGAGNVNVNSEIGGDVIAQSSAFSLGSGAVVNGNLNLTSSDYELDEAQVLGLITIKTPEKKEFKPNKWMLGFFGTVILLIISIVLVLLMPKQSVKISDLVGKKFWKVLLYGILTIIAVPIIALLIAITIIGIPIALILILLYALALYLSKIFVLLYVGRQILGKKTVWAVVLGVILYAVLVNIPFLGHLVRLIVVILGMGALSLWMFSRKKK